MLNFDEMSDRAMTETRTKKNEELLKAISLKLIYATMEQDTKNPLYFNKWIGSKLLSIQLKPTTDNTGISINAMFGATTDIKPAYIFNSDKIEEVIKKTVGFAMVQEYSR